MQNVPATAAMLAIRESAKRVENWVEAHNYEAYEPFDCLSSPVARVVRGSLFLERLLQQVGRQSPINFRPALGVRPLPSTKGRGYMAAGYITMYQLTHDPIYRKKAKDCLEWLIANKSPKFAESSWANHFDYASRGGRYSKHESIIVWSALIGQAFLDAFDVFGESRYLDVAESVCRWILRLPRERTRRGDCLSYHMLGQNSVHNANMLGAGLLARTWSHSRRPEYFEVASSAMEYSCSRQRADGSWWYGEDPKYHWIDNFHTAYNLDSLLCYSEASKDEKYLGHLQIGLAYYKKHFLEKSGRPRYYHDRTFPIDIQCASQAIETLSKFVRVDGECLRLATGVANWTIRHMQARDGHFYYRLYPGVRAKMPMMHWGQATMYRALSVLLQMDAASKTRQRGEALAVAAQ